MVNCHLRDHEIYEYDKIVIVLKGEELGCSGVPEQQVPAE